MDQSKVIKGTKNVGADGLSKKERRALKIQAAVSKSPKAEPDTSLTVKIDGNISDHNTKPVPRSQDISDKELNKKVPLETKLNEDLTIFRKSETQINVNKVTQNTSETISKNELRTRRRALQEAQRLAKLNVKQEQPKAKPEQQKNELQTKSNLTRGKALSPKKDSVKISNLHKHKVLLFNHLYFENGNVASFKDGNISNSSVHPEFLKLGSRYASKTVLGSNARCLALLSAFKKLILDFKTPAKQEFCRSLESTMQVCFSHIGACRPPAVSMTNALRHIKLHLSQINTNLSDNEKRNRLLDCIEIYINDEIAKAGEAISMQVFTKISNGDVILTYGCSSLITKILLDAHSGGKKFKVIVVDARPLLEGKEMLRKLVCAGMQCTYILINAASFVMSGVSKVLLGAHALLANGYVMSRTGTAQVALIANSYKKPVLVCCETYKFCERVQTDSFVYNEIGDPDKLVANDALEGNSPLTNWQSSNYLTPLNLMYDVTPPDLVTAVVTELAFLPCTSVPVILRIRPTEIMV